MRRTLGIFGATWALTFAAGCKTPTDSAALETDSPRAALLVGFGGWNSCRLQSDPTTVPPLAGFGLSAPGTSVDATPLLTPANSFTFAQLGHLADALRASGVDTKWMATCFGLGLPRDSDIWTLTSEGEARQMDAMDVGDQIAENATGRQVILIGHSYGGWMSATVAARLARPVLGLFTLEAISGEGCPEFAALPGVAAQFPDCQRAPSGGSVDVARIQAHTGLWVNIHLPAAGRDLDVYSGPLPAPVEDVELPYTNISSGPFSNAHHLLGLGKPTWDRICSETRELLAVPGPCTALEVDRWGVPTAPR